MRSKTTRYPVPQDVVCLDTTLGNDAFSGNAAAPLKTLAAANALNWRPTMKGLLKCGETFTGILAPIGHGLANRRIYFGSYGVGAKPIIDGAAAQVAAFRSYLTSSGIILDGLDLRGGTIATVEIFSPNIAVQNCAITGNGSSRADGIQMDSHAYNIHILYNTATGAKCTASGGAGIMATSVVGLVIIGNTSNSNGTDSLDHGIYIKSCQNVLAKKNITDSNTGNGIQVQNTGTLNVVLDSNSASLNGLDGFYAAILDAASLVKLINNIANHNTGANLHTGLASAGILVYHNTLVNGGTNGLVIGDVGVVKNNLVVQDYAVVGNKRCVRSENGTTIPPTFDYNSYYYPGNSDSDKVANQTTPANGYTFAQWQALGADAHGFMSDPKLVTPYTDLHIQTTSPCKNASDATVGIAQDFDGILRGTQQVDIGAYKFV
jgi:hypothetical protein